MFRGTAPICLLLGARGARGGCKSTPCPAMPGDTKPSARKLSNGPGSELRGGDGQEQAWRDREWRRDGWRGSRVGAAATRPAYSPASRLRPAAACQRADRQPNVHLSALSRHRASRSQVRAGLRWRPPGQAGGVAWRNFSPQPGRRRLCDTPTAPTTLAPPVATSEHGANRMESITAVFALVRLVRLPVRTNLRSPINQLTIT